MQIVKLCVGQQYWQVRQMIHDSKYGDLLRDTMRYEYNTVQATDWYQVSIAVLHKSTKTLSPCSIFRCLHIVQSLNSKDKSLWSNFKWWLADSVWLSLTIGNTGKLKEQYFTFNKSNQCVINRAWTKYVFKKMQNCGYGEYRRFLPIQVLCL